MTRGGVKGFTFTSQSKDALNYCTRQTPVGLYCARLKVNIMIISHFTLLPIGCSSVKINQAKGLFHTGTALRCVPAMGVVWYVTAQGPRT